MFAPGVCALWDRGGPYRTIRHRDRSVASSASKCDIPQCTRPPEPGRAVHTHCPDPGHTSGGEDDMVCIPPLLSVLHCPDPLKIICKFKSCWVWVSENSSLFVSLIMNIRGEGFRSRNLQTQQTVVCTTTFIFYALKENKTINHERSCCG